MIKNILVFQDLISKLPALRQELRALGVNVLIVTGGKDALEKAIKLKAQVVLLGQTMPQMSGIETFVAMKEAIPDIKIFVISKNPNEGIPEEFLSEHPDVVVSLAQAQKTIGESLLPLLNGNVTEYLKKDLSVPKDSIDQRLSPRVIAQGFIEFEIAGAKYKGSILNLSRTGVLFGSVVEIPLGHECVLDMHSPNGKTIPLKTQILRVKKEENPSTPVSYSVGARFLEVSPQDLEQLDLWIAALRTVLNQIEEQVEAGSENVPAQIGETSETSAGKVDFFFENARLDAQAITINTNWILLESEKTFSEGALLKVLVTTNTGAVIETSAQVVKSQQKKENLVRVGAKYVFVDEAQKKGIQDWASQYGPILSREVAPPDAKFVQRLLTMPSKDVVSFILEHPFDPRLRFVGVLSSLEKSALRQEDSASACIQKLIVLRAQCGLFLDFVPTIQANVKVVGDAFFKILAAMLAETDYIERETEEQVKKAVAEENGELRQQLNASSNMLHDVMVKMLRSVVDRLAHTPVASDPLFEDLSQRLIRLGLRKPEAVDVRYDRKKEEKKEEKKSKKKGYKISKKIKVGLALSVLAAIGTFVFRSSTGYISVSKLNVEFDLSKAVLVEDGVDLYCNTEQWERLRNEDKEKTMENIEKYLTAERLKQAKLLDEKGKLLAATSVVERPVGKPPVYRRRMKGTRSF